MESAALGAVAFVNEDKQLTDRRAGLVFEVTDKCIEVIHAFLAELVDQ